MAVQCLSVGGETITEAELLARHPEAANPDGSPKVNKGHPVEIWSTDEP